MNFNDISEFLDLVKNPAKYEKALKDLKDEQDRLTAVIETVGKASELDKLRKQVELKADKLEKEFAKKQEELQKSAASQEQQVADKKLELESAISKAKRISDEAESRIAASESVSQDYKRREKSIRQQEEFLAQESARVAEMAKEYEDKLAKLRAVMG